MKLENRSTVPASFETTWALVTDIPKAAACIPGIKEVTPDGEKVWEFWNPDMEQDRRRLIYRFLRIPPSRLPEIALQASQR